MFAKAVVAISRTGGVPESTAPSMLTFSFDPENPEQMAQALQRLDDLTAAELAQLGRSGRDFVEQRYDIRNLNRELLATTLQVTS
jgi:glycosyltransferase involved in cell wall biosynthesis